MLDSWVSVASWDSFTFSWSNPGCSVTVCDLQHGRAEAQAGLASSSSCCCRLSQSGAHATPGLTADEWRRLTSGIFHPLHLLISHSPYPHSSWHGFAKSWHGYPVHSFCVPKSRTTGETPLETLRAILHEVVVNKRLQEMNRFKL